MNTRRRRTKSGSKEENKENFQSGYGIPLVNSGKTFADSQNLLNSASLDSIDMSCRDRTGEFLSAVKSLQSSQVQISIFLYLSRPLFAIYYNLNIILLLFIRKLI